MSYGSSETHVHASRDAVCAAIEPHAWFWLHGDAVLAEDLKVYHEDSGLRLCVVWPTDVDGWTVIESDFGGRYNDEHLAGVVSRATASTSVHGFHHNGYGGQGWTIFDKGEQVSRRDSDLAEASGYRFRPDSELPETGRSVWAAFESLGRELRHEPFHLDRFAGRDVTVFVLLNE